jgi:Flp pilus assembly protein TadG
MLGAGAHRPISGLLSRLVSFGRDRRAVAAVEFAFIAPILLIMYFITVEAVQAIETSKKVSRLGSMVADLVAQQDQVSTTVLQQIMDIGSSTMRPYNRSDPEILITAIKVSNDSNANPTVAWSYQRKTDGGYKVPYTKNSAVILPADLKVAGTFLIRVQSNLAYNPIIAWALDGNKATGLAGIFSNKNMNETYYLRPRVLQEIACSDC